MITCGDRSEIIWNLTVLKETEDGLLCMSPSGDTQFLTHQEYELYLSNKKERHGN